jgi:hypothetical protein
VKIQTLNAVCDARAQQLAVQICPDKIIKLLNPSSQAFGLMLQQGRLRSELYHDDFDAFLKMLDSAGNLPSRAGFFR